MTSTQGLGGPPVSTKRGCRVMKPASIRDDRQGLHEYRLQQEQLPRSHLVPMRWEQHSLANQLAVAQLLRIPRPRLHDLSSIASIQFPSKKPRRPTVHSAEKLVRDSQSSSSKSNATSSLTKEVQVQISRLESGSYGSAGLVASGKGYSQWHYAFEDLMEDLLEDAEDMLLNLPYTDIRKALAYSREILCNTKEARLVVRMLDQSKGLLINQPGSGPFIISPQNFSNAIWADPEFDVSRRSLISERPKQILYMLHDVVRELVEAYYYPQVTLHDIQPRKKLIKCLDELGDYPASGRGHSLLLQIEDDRYDI